MCLYLSFFLSKRASTLFNNFPILLSACTVDYVGEWKTSEMVEVATNMLGIDDEIFAELTSMDPTFYDRLIKVNRFCSRSFSYYLFSSRIFSYNRFSSYIFSYILFSYLLL